LNKTEKLPERQDKINLSDNTIYMFLSCLSGRIWFIYVFPQVFDHAVMIPIIIGRLFKSKQLLDFIPDIH